MKGSLNITSIVLFIVSSIILYGSNIWILIHGSIPKDKSVTVAATNLVALFSLGVGNVLNQIIIYKKDKQLESVKHQMDNIIL